MVKVSVVTIVGHSVEAITFDQLPTILLTDFQVIFLLVEMLNDSYHPAGTLEHPSIFLTEVGPCCYVWCAEFSLLACYLDKEVDYQNR